ncbi:MAG: hypothetical protein M4579_007237 [Chaenotheca gracillima]|nr:MAG: hypothetical protein M4579_007237 [Chaenotheca gracillima]
MLAQVVATSPQRGAEDLSAHESEAELEEEEVKKRQGKRLQKIRKAEVKVAEGAGNEKLRALFGQEEDRLKWKDYKDLGVEPELMKQLTRTLRDNGAILVDDPHMTPNARKLRKRPALAIEHVRYEDEDEEETFSKRRKTAKAEVLDQIEDESLEEHGTKTDVPMAGMDEDDTAAAADSAGLAGSA